jgi:hypothetical protein
VAAALAAAGIGSSHGGSAFGFGVGRHFSIRDVLKWCRRMASVSHPSLPCSLFLHMTLTLDQVAGN